MIRSPCDTPTQLEQNTALWTHSWRPTSCGTLGIGAEKENVTTFEVKVSVVNGAKQLKANMTANAEIVLEEHPDSLIIPEAAITYDAKRNPTVEMLDPLAKTGRKTVIIKTGVGNGTRTQVITGLKQGDKVILPS